MHWYEYLILALYLLAGFLLFIYSLGQMHLAFQYLQYRRRQPEPQPPNPEEWPAVTVQLPVYNEKFVIERLIDAVCRLDYPTGKLEIQVLDDSTDETSELAATRIDRYRQQGINIRHVQRSGREGFKAGALAYGLEQASGEYIAIFDADFVPPADFLRKTIPWFADPRTGVVQTRWGHLNRQHSLFTRMQAFGLDAHFSVEQSGRSSARSFINFNGTAGVWRKACIADAGGWSADTLTEDLDLSYRAQLRGWRFRYLEEVAAPAELPILMPAIKSQQYRWNKGAAETARKLLGRVLRQRLPLITKIHAVFHLLNSSVFLVLLALALLSLPILVIKGRHPELAPVFWLANILLAGFFAIGFYFWVAGRKAPHTRLPERFLPAYLTFMTFSMGLALHNGLAVLEGFLGRRSPFVRTPKFHATGRSWQTRSLAYLSPRTGLIPWLELALAVYFLAGIGLAFYLQDFGLVAFHLMLTAGFFVIGFKTLIPVNRHVAAEKAG